MANFDYADMQSVAHELITEAGQHGTITRTTAPAGPGGGTPTTAAYAATLVPMTYDAKLIDGTRIQSGDVQIYISAVGLAISPRAGDVASVNGKKYSIISVDPNLYDGVTPVVHICQARIA